MHADKAADQRRPRRRDAHRLEDDDQCEVDDRDLQHEHRTQVDPKISERHPQVLQDRGTPVRDVPIVDVAQERDRVVVDAPWPGRHRHRREDPQRTTEHDGSIDIDPVGSPRVAGCLYERVVDNRHGTKLPVDVLAARIVRRPTVDDAPVSRRSSRAHRR